MALKKIEGKKTTSFKKMTVSCEAVLNTDKRQQIPKTIISICLHCSKSRAFIRPQSFLLTCKDLSVIKIPKIKV